VPSQLQEIVDAIRRRPFVEPLIELERFAKDETLHGQGGQERRRFRRYSLITNVVVLPLDDQLRPIGEPFVALSSGMSLDGMRLIYTDPPPTATSSLRLTASRFASCFPSCAVARLVTASRSPAAC
jgi:hypothetical protein